jgi:hypothetical protein
MQVSGAATIRARSPQTYRYWTEQEVSARDAQQIEKDAPRANFDLGALREAALGDGTPLKKEKRVLGGKAKV